MTEHPEIRQTMDLLYRYGELVCELERMAEADLILKSVWVEARRDNIKSLREIVNHIEKFKETMMRVMPIGGRG